MIKIKNVRHNGNLFHYAHFICDCLFPEIINEIYKYNVVVREKNLHQTIGNFDKIYNEVMIAENKEYLKEEYDNLNVDTIIYKPKEYYSCKESFLKFRNYIFSRYNIDKFKYNTEYPEVILIQRGERIKLIDDPILNKLCNSSSTATWDISTGKERREINNISRLKIYLQNKYNNKFKSFYFEGIDFQKQVNLFNNAKLIICAHGAVLSNMFFCKKNTYIIEATGSCTGSCSFEFFDIISKLLNLNHIKCHDDNKIIDCIENISYI